VLYHGECREMRIWLSNIGTQAISEIWLVGGEDDEFCVGDPETVKASAHGSETFDSDNSLLPRTPHKISWTSAVEDSSLAPGANFELPFVLHANKLGEQELCLLFTFREGDGHAFHCVKIARSFEVRPLLSATLAFEPGRALENIFTSILEVRNVADSTPVVVSQMVTLSPMWSCKSVTSSKRERLLPSQSFQSLMGVNLRDDVPDFSDTFQFVVGKFEQVLKGQPVGESPPPPLSMRFNYIVESSDYCINTTSTMSLLHQGRRNLIARELVIRHPYISPALHPNIFPLYHPHSLDVLIFWDIPSSERSGHVLISGVNVGAEHGALNAIIQETQELKVKRSMYAETDRERSSILEAVRASEWNAEMNPVSLTAIEPGVINHDFSERSCQIPVTFMLRNFSMTHPSKYTLRLASSEASTNDPPGTKNFAPPSWIGRLTFRGTLEPMQHVTLTPTLLVTGPDTHALESWQLEVEVGQKTDQSWRTIYRYLEKPSKAHRPCVTVVAIASSS